MREAWPPVNQWTMPASTRSAVRPERERKMWRGVAARKAVRFACGKDRLDIAPTCCCPMSEAMALHRLTAGAAAIGVSCLAGSRRDLAIARAGRARTSCPIILRTPVGICSTFTSLTYKEPIAAGISCHHISRTVWRAAWLAKCGVCVGLSRRPCWR